VHDVVFEANVSGAAVFVLYIETLLVEVYASSSNEFQWAVLLKRFARPSRS
jgi:hypothetical protein